MDAEGGGYVGTYTETRPQGGDVRLVHTLDGRERRAEDRGIVLVYPLFDHVGRFILVRFVCGEVLGDFFETVIVPRDLDELLCAR